MTRNETTARRPTLYLAEPALFRTSAAVYKIAVKGLCDRLGATGLYPTNSDDENPMDSAEVRQENLEMIRTCDAVIADMTQYWVSASDVITGYEMGFAAALGKPVFAYSLSNETDVERVRTDHMLSQIIEGKLHKTVEAAIECAVSHFTARGTNPIPHGLSRSPAPTDDGRQYLAWATDVSSSVPAEVPEWMVVQFVRGDGDDKGTWRNCANSPTREIRILGWRPL